MRLEHPRIHPVADEDLNEEQQQILETLNEVARNMNLFRTTLRSAETMKGMLSWSNYVGSKKANDVPWREKEIIILRTSYQCKSAYEWSHHTRLGKYAGLEEKEIAALSKTIDEYPWKSEDLALITMCDELVQDHFVSDETWNDLTQFLTEKQQMDAVYTAAHYGMVSKFANTFGVQIEEGVHLEEHLKEHFQSLPQ